METGPGHEPKEAMDTSEALVTSGRHLPYGFSDATVQRALELMMGTRSVREAYRLLKQEAKPDVPVPAYETLWMWARQSEECLLAVTHETKRELVAISTDAATAWGANMVELADNPQGLKPTEIGINYGIAMDKRTAWENAGNKAPQMAVQFNLVTKS